MADLIEFAAATPIDRDDAISSVVLTPVPLPDQPFTMGVTTFPPGMSIALHSHNCVEQVTVIEGEALVELNGGTMPAVPYDTTQVAAGEFHRFINAGSGPMRILWAYGSTDVTRTFPTPRVPGYGNRFGRAGAIGRRTRR
jgi:quercetin dioxygenase-like cupin family protein